MAALRLGVPPKFVAPHFIQALEFSEDADEFYRHLLNACNSVVYGFDDPTEADAALDVLADCVLRLIEQRSEPEYRHNNRGYLTRLIDVYRHMAQFRSFFAHAEWALAKGELDLARRGFRQMGLENAVRGLTSIQATFELARSISAYVENIADGLYKEPGAALAKCIDLQKQCNVRKNQPDKYPMFERLQKLLAAFLDGIAMALTYLSGQRSSFIGLQDQCSIIQALSVDYFSNLGKDLLTALSAVDKICSGVAIMVNRRASPDLTHDDKYAAWRTICLLLNGLHLDFRAIDIALARGYLGWVYDPRQECKRIVQGFKTFIERQAWRDLYVGGAPQENIARALLQAYLIPRNDREIFVKGGRSDILMFERDRRCIFEMKIWRGQSYFNTGLSEIEQYIEGEGDDGRLRCAFYIILDPTMTDRAVGYVAQATCRHVSRKRTLR